MIKIMDIMDKVRKIFCVIDVVIYKRVYWQKMKIEYEEKFLIILDGSVFNMKIEGGNQD